MASVLAVLVVVIAMPLNWYVTARLFDLYHRDGNPVIRERAFVALAFALVVTVFAAVFVNNELHPPPLDNEATKLITRSAVLALSVVPSIYFLRLYR